MQDSDLLEILVQYLYKEKDRIKHEIDILREKHPEITSEQREIINQISIKEDYLASITRDSIDKYQYYWASLKQHDRRPCPFCFISRHDSQCFLKPLPGNNKVDVIKCEICKRKFYLPNDIK